jgi:hypothetical protein
VPHLIEYFKHPCCAKARKDEIATTVRLLEDLHPKKWTRRGVRMWFQGNENRDRLVQIDDHMNAGFAPVPCSLPQRMVCSIALMPDISLSQCRIQLHQHFPVGRWFSRTL